jgi:hypothetical protein
LNCYTQAEYSYHLQYDFLFYFFLSNNYQKINNQTEELEGNSEDYASLANELLKKMQKRKWWQI